MAGIANRCIGGGLGYCRVVYFKTLFGGVKVNALPLLKILIFTLLNFKKWQLYTIEDKNSPVVLLGEYEDNY